MNGDGQLDAEEVALLATRLGKDMSPDELRQAMTEMDTDGDGLAVPRSSSLCDGLSKGLLRRMVWLCRTVDSEEFERWWEEKGIKTHMAQQLFKEYAPPPRPPFPPLRPAEA